MISGQHQGGRKKYFYKFVKALRKDLCSIPTLVKDGLSYNTTVTWIILNQHFYSVSNKESSSALPDMGPSPHLVMIPGVVKLLQEVDPFNAVWPDRLLKEFSHELAPSLILIFRTSIHQSSLPLDWKTALVTSLFKKGSRSNPTNFPNFNLL